MLVYANHITCNGTGAEGAILKAIRRWIKEQLGFGLHLDVLKKDGEFDGKRGETPSWLRIYATDEEEPKFYAWIVNNTDDAVHGRKWTTEIGLRVIKDCLEFSCILKTDEQSTLVTEPASASRPRVIRYIVDNIQQAKNAEFAESVTGLDLKTIGQDRDSYRSFLVEIERKGRDRPIVLVSPDREGAYLINANLLQENLFGLAQVVEVIPGFNSYEMEEILGQQRSAWDGAVNILHIPTLTGFVRGHFFLSNEIEEWGNTPHYLRISRLLAWVTNHTNVRLQRKCIRPEGVMQLAVRRRLQVVRERSDQMNAGQLRQELEQAYQRLGEQENIFNELTEENSLNENTNLELKEQLQDKMDEVSKKEYEIQSLKDNLASKGAGRASNLDAEKLLNLASSKNPPLPRECLDIIENLYGDKCIILN